MAINDFITPIDFMEPQGITEFDMYNCYVTVYSALKLPKEFYRMERYLETKQDKYLDVISDGCEKILESLYKKEIKTDSDYKKIYIVEFVVKNIQNNIERYKQLNLEDNHKRVGGM